MPLGVSGRDSVLHVTFNWYFHAVSSTIFVV